MNIPEPSVKSIKNPSAKHVNQYPQLGETFRLL